MSANRNNNACQRLWVKILAEADGDSMDAAAARSFADFEREIEQWSMSTETKTSRHAYTDFAAHLSAK